MARRISLPARHPRGTLPSNPFHGCDANRSWFTEAETNFNKRLQINDNERLVLDNSQPDCPISDAKSSGRALIRCTQAPEQFFKRF